MIAAILLSAALLQSDGQSGGLQNDAEPIEGASAPLSHPHEQLDVPDSVGPIPPGTVLRIGTCELPPWSVKPSTSNPVWSGVAVHLTREAAQQIGVQTELHAYTFDGLRDALARGEVDVAASGIPITPENLSRFALTPAFDESGLSIATHLRPPLTFLTVIDRVFTEQVVLWGGTLGLMCVLFGTLLWAAERKRNPPFEGSPARGIAEASWWSVVTMFTVGYGDRVPVTLRGKVLAVVWMSLAFVLVTVASGLVTSALTVQQLRPVVTGPRELAKARVGCIADTAGQDWLRAANIDFTPYKDYETAVNALASDRVDALVGSTVVLAYLIDRSHSHSLIVLPQRMRTDYVGLGLRYGLSDALEKRFEMAMLKVSQSDSFRAYRNALMGEAAREGY